jgi:hypothetical protein
MTCVGRTLEFKMVHFVQKMGQMLYVTINKFPILLIFDTLNLLIFVTLNYILCKVNVAELKLHNSSTTLHKICNTIAACSYLYIRTYYK